MKRFLFISLAVILIGGLFLSGCAETAPAPAPAAPAPAPKPAPAPAAPAPAPAAPAPAPKPAPAPAAPAPAPVIKLTFGGKYAATVPHTIGDLAWIDKIEKDTNGRVDIVYYPECTLTSSREHYDELIAGVCDIAYTSVETKYGFQIQRATQPWMYGVPKDVVRWRIYKELCAKYPEILAEFARTKNLSLGPGMEYQLVTTKPVRTPEDIKGMSVKAMGAFADWIAAMGGEGIPMSMGEAYISLQKGIIDGVLAPYEVFKSLRLGEVADYVTVLNSTQAPYAERGMNWDTWNSLPPDIQKVFDDNSDFFASAISNAFNALNEGGIAIAKEQGVVFIEPAPEDIDRFNKYMEGVCLKSAAELDAMGYHGTEMYNDTRRLAEEYMK